MTRELLQRSRKRHAFTETALVLLAGALLLSLVIAFGAVSIGIERAGTIMAADGSTGRLELAMLLGIVIAGTGGVTAALVPNDKPAPDDRQPSDDRS